MQKPKKTVNLLQSLDPVRFPLISGKQICEPISCYGPIVLNMKDDLCIAFEEYDNWTFIKHKKSG
jgi:redox-sensitive bicupin YhaK (pirin superfamily)